MNNGSVSDKLYVVVYLRLNLPRYVFMQKKTENSKRRYVLPAVISISEHVFKTTFDNFWFWFSLLLKPKKRLRVHLHVQLTVELQIWSSCWTDQGNRKNECLYFLLWWHLHQVSVMVCSDFLFFSCGKWSGQTLSKLATKRSFKSPHLVVEKYRKTGGIGQIHNHVSMEQIQI